MTFDELAGSVTRTLQGDPATAWLVNDWPNSALLVAVAIFFLASLVLNRRGLFRRRYRGRSARVHRFGKGPRAQVRAPSPADPADQMRIVSGTDFRTRRLLNQEEARLLPVLEDYVARLGNRHRLMAQTSLGEIIAPTDKDPERSRLALACINSKRLDFAIFDRGGRLVAAVEYQGGGHYRETSFMRDAVKREVLRKAGVPMVEIKPQDRPADVFYELNKYLPLPAKEGRSDVPLNQAGREA